MIFFYKLLFVIIFGFIGYKYPPFQVNSKYIGSLLGVGFALGLSLLSFRIRKSELKYLWSAHIGFLLGLLMGYILFNLMSLIAISFSSYIFFKAFFLIGIPITGTFIGVLKPDMFSPLNIKEFFRGSSVLTDSFLLDTSAIIDGRIVPIVSSGFIEGELIISQFVLSELQSIADMNDSNKKNRGKRGLDVIDRLKQKPSISLTILNKDIVSAKDVDYKLVLLAKEYNFKIITNDINLSKIAKLQDIKVLNINELAVAIKPIIFPGEHLNIQITKEGKEKSQGLAYLDDGTMIVIEDGKTEIGKKLDIEITSVLQSTSGKMFFARKI